MYLRFPTSRLRSLSHQHPLGPESLQSSASSSPGCAPHSSHAQYPHARHAARRAARHSGHAQRPQPSQAAQHDSQTGAPGQVQYEQRPERVRAQTPQAGRLSDAGQAAPLCRAATHGDGGAAPPRLLAAEVMLDRSKKAKADMEQAIAAGSDGIRLAWMACRRCDPLC